MSTNKIKAKIDAKLEDFRKKKEALLAEIQEEFPKMFEELFTESELIESVSWTQFTDYFNDGDECTFSAHLDLDYYCEVNGENLDDIDDLHPLNVLRDEIYGTLTEENYHLHQEYAKGRSWISPKPVGERAYMKNPNYNSEERAILENIIEAISGLGDDFLKDLFGDHKRITIKTDGTIKVEDFTDHD